MNARVPEPRDISLEEDHGDDDGPELDEALAPELGETEFAVEVDLGLEQRDIHEVDEQLAQPGGEG
jgi:hypothetical protein